MSETERQEVTWETLRMLCAEAGIGPEFDQYEIELKSKLTNALLSHFKRENLYLADPVFRNQVNELIAIIVGALTHTFAAGVKTTDMDALTKLFQDEVQSHRGG